MPCRALSRTRDTTATAVLQQRDITRVAPCRAVWKCDCGFTNRLFFDRKLVVGSVYGQKMHCGACGNAYRGMFITGPFGRY